MRSLPTRVALALSPALGLSLLAGCAKNGDGNAAGAFAPSNIEGRAIVVLCDGDMNATALADGRLGESTRDHLTCLALPISDSPDLNAAKWNTTFGQADVSSSMLGPPSAVAVSPDGTRAYAVESRKPAKPGQTMLDELAPGSTLSVVDVSNPASPALLGTMDVGVSPCAVDVSPAGDLLAIITQTPRQEIVIVQTDAMVPPATSAATPAGPLGQKWAWPLIGIENPDAKPSSITWHPSGRYFAVTIPQTNQVAFYEYAADARGQGIPGIAPWGAPVSVGKFPFSGHFSRDGRFFIFSELMWGPDVEGFMTGAPEGQLAVIKLSEVASSVDANNNFVPDRVYHDVVDSVKVGISPESLALSPAGNLLVAGNIRRAFLPEGDTRLTPGGSISLVSFDEATGKLAVLSETPIKGMPEGIAFDATGKHVIVSAFRSFDAGALDGELAFYTVQGNSLRFCGFNVAVGKGPHSLVVIR